MSLGWSLVYRFFLLPGFFCLYLLFAVAKAKVRRSLIIRFRMSFDFFLGSINQVFESAKGKEVVLFHTASVGEYAHALSVAREIKTKNPDYFIALSYSSTSLFEWLQKTARAPNHPFNLEVLYPWDFKPITKILIRDLNPKKIIFAKADLWPEFLSLALEKKIPLYLVSATLSAESLKFKIPLVRDFYIRLLSGFNKILVVTEADKNRFETVLGGKLKTIPEVTVCGDARISNLLLRAEDFCNSKTETFKLLQPAKDWAAKFTQPIWVLGSVWPADIRFWGTEFFLDAARNKDIRIILAPHDLSTNSLGFWHNKLNQWKLEFELFSHGQKKSNVLLVDRLGLLAGLYSLAQWAYVGSGRGGVHNTLEPLCYGVPVLFGPKRDRAPETEEILRQKAGICLQDQRDFISFLNLPDSEKKSITSNAQNFKKHLESHKNVPVQICRQLF